MRVLVVNAWDGASGVLTVIRSLAIQLAGKGVIYSSFNFNSWDENSPWRSCCDNLYDARQIPLAELLGRRHFDIVHLVDTACAPAFNPKQHLNRAAFSGGVLCMSQNSEPVIVTPPSADVYIACSKASQQVMAATIPDTIQIIPNAVDLSVFQPVEPTLVPRCPVLAWVGRASDRDQKDLAGFLHLAALNWANKLDFLVVDADPMAAPDTCQWLSGRVRYLARQSATSLVDLYAQVRASGGAVVSTSRFEGMSLVLLEAAACGCPVIAPRVSGTDHLVHGKTALLYDRAGGLDAIGHCVQSLSNNRLRSLIAEEGLRAVQERHDVRDMARLYFDAYNDCIAAADRRRAGIRFGSIAWRAAYAGRRSLRWIIGRQDRV